MIVSVINHFHVYRTSLIYQRVSEKRERTENSGIFTEHYCMASTLLGPGTEK